jgi:AAA domain (dynein-related subfamily)
MSQSSDELASERGEIAREPDEITRAREEIAREQASLARERESLAQQRADLAARAAVIRELGDSLAQRERAVAARELVADTGFAERRTTATKELEAELAALREQHAAAIEADRAAFNEHLERQRTQLDEQRRSLDDERAILADQAADLRRERVALDQREQQLDKEARMLAASEIQRLEDDLHLAGIKLAGNAETIKRLTEELAEIQARWQATGTEDPRLILARLEKVTEENREFRDKLAARLDDDTLDRLRRLEEQNHQLNAERERLEYELRELQGTQLADRISNLQVQQLSDAQEQFDIIRRGYEMRIAELRGALSEVVDGRADPTEPLFPKCVALDDDPELQVTGHLIDDEIPDLRRLARELQGAMWQRSGRAYCLDDVCGVLGGLAMSQLHLLEGPSGIGKTSLPLALADALGTGCAVIEVQAGWRDRYDLFGHYNTFERRFTEEPFLLALYKAQTPRYRDRPFFIVLDEMNLARPEQYFSVLLSKLETRDTAPIELVPVATGRKPRWLDASGTGISLPGNVWFVGTANQDESTLEFADKTYNRSYVLELSSERPHVTGRGQVQPYSVRALREAFVQAGRQHGDKLERVKDLLADLKEDLYEVGRIQLHPRLEKQLGRYVPVVIAAFGADAADAVGAHADGGRIDPVALAADQFLASKLLHQLHSRFEVTPEGIGRLQENIEEYYWPGRFPGTEPLRCRRVLADELRRRKA